VLGDGNIDPLRVVGRYAMYREIASGGMASVHIGRLIGPVGFARTVAIKRLHPQFAKDPEFAAMFLDEARLVSRIRHPNVVQTLDVVSLEGELFLIMDFVHGESLARLSKAALAQGSKAPPTVAAAIMASVLYGLHAAHEARDSMGNSLGIVHRDVSPHNIIVGVDGVARVLDFGVAYAAGRVGSTRDGHIKGKIAYMSPEQLNGEIVDRRTDVYAASVVLWELFAGRRLFDADNQGQLLNRVLSGATEPPSTYCPQLSKGVEAVVMRGLSRDSKDRWPTAREMAVAIERSAGVATPSMVGAWVESAQGDRLAVRAAQLAVIEQCSLSEDELTPSHIATRGFVSSATVATPIAPALSSASATASQLSAQSLHVSVEVEVDERSWRTPSAWSRISSRARVALALVASCAIGVLFGGFVLTERTGTTKDAHVDAVLRRDQPFVTTVMSDDQLARATRSNASAPRAPNTGTAGVSASESEAPPATAASASAMADAAVATATTSTRTRPTFLTKPVVNPASCKPPFTFDAMGHKKYKLECL
jgi:eukaryotic-like serine/threonine-protein kinase